MGIKYPHPVPPSSASCIVHRKRLRAAGRLVINFLTGHCTEDVVYLKKHNAGLANSPRISSAISTDHTGMHGPIKCEPYCYSKSSDGSPIVRIPSLCTSMAEISEGQNPRILTRLTCSNGLTVYITRKTYHEPFPNFAKASTSHPSIPLFIEKGETKSKSLRHGRTLEVLTVVYYTAHQLHRFFGQSRIVTCHPVLLKPRKVRCSPDATFGHSVKLRVSDVVRRDCQ